MRQKTLEKWVVYNIRAVAAEDGNLHAEQCLRVAKERMTLLTAAREVLRLREEDSRDPMMVRALAGLYAALLLAEEPVDA